MPICGFKAKGGRLVNNSDICVLGLDESIHAGQSKFNGWISKLGLNNADAQALAQSLGTQIDGKTIYAVEEATTGRFIVQADRGTIFVPSGSSARDPDFRSIRVFGTRP